MTDKPQNIQAKINQQVELFINTYPQELETRKNWYSNIAQTYNYIRPSYPQNIINQGLSIAKLPENANILEIGCGPGIATLPYAKLGFNILALEPSLPACEIAKQNLANYPHVQFLQTTLEEFTPQKITTFDAVLAANSWHWLNPEIVYNKTADLLRNNGILILLWNMTPQLNYHLYQNIEEIYQIYAPSLAKYETIEHQKQIIASWKENTLKSEKFTHLNTQIIIYKKNYTIDDYLLLLSTFTPYLKLNSEIRNSLFISLKAKIETYYQRNIEVTYVSAGQLFQKVI
ncbi:class I SAM-dependent methyltransferase [Anabaena sp. FACHB-1237]|uniref:class I SAM-dependent methyltransferase n=1 Tax=Anabaena sp. FACHB-1237 TaxID=2692769 RepID=UPI00168047C9|nr:class I SAM-dependent methyltransferase [Anabaena sp. FACHB-1237]MBD2138620.1 class I SAM-dependent methyltransferase [Anabaena sp. FACHB-1237]